MEGIKVAIAVNSLVGIPGIVNFTFFPKLGTSE